MVGAFFSNSKFRKSFMPEHLDLWCQLANDDLHYIICCKPFVECADHLKCLHYAFLCFNFFFGVRAIIAVATILLGIFLTEITQQDLSSAYAAFSICHRFVDELRTHLSFAEGLVAHQVLQL